MKFALPLVSGRLVQRYKRFLADVRLDDGEAVTAACPNTGSMLGLTAPGSRVWLSANDRPTRKYRHTWEMIEADGGRGATLVGINTNHPNAIVSEAIVESAIPELKGFNTARREVKYGLNSRIDILLEGGPDSRNCYVEIKNVHLMRDAGLAEFPDSKTERGAKHLGELANVVREGHRAVMMFLVQRGDADEFKIAGDIDPAYAAAYLAAADAGVEMICYRCTLTADAIAIDRCIPLRV